MLISGDKVGIGLRPLHYYQILEERPKIDWLEVHPENFMVKGGYLLDILSSIRTMYPISFHGIGLSLGSSMGLNRQYLKRIKTLIHHFDPVLISDHLSWSNAGPQYFPDLFPIPYNQESLVIFENNIDAAQTYLQRTLLIENPSSYLEYNTSTYPEAEFLTELIKRTGAKILLDINNIYVSCMNHSWNPIQYIKTIPYESVAEIHIAGHSIIAQNEHNNLLLDTHDNFVCQDVWDLYSYAIKHIGLVPTLLEWDANIPNLEVLLNEAKKSVYYLKHTTNTARFY